MAQRDFPPPNHSVNSMPGSLDKEAGSDGLATADHLEVIRTVSRVPGNTHYYEKDGLRTYGDDEDHDHEPPVGIDAYIFEGSYLIMCSIDDYASVDVFGRHGFLMDRFSNTSISFR